MKDVSEYGDMVDYVYPPHACLQTGNGAMTEVNGTELNVPLRTSNGDFGTEITPFRNGSDSHVFSRGSANAAKQKEDSLRNGNSNLYSLHSLNGMDGDLNRTRDRTRPYRCADVCRNDGYACGMCSFKPRWLQPFANKKTFLAVFCLTSVLQGMYYTYFVSVLTTIEKLFQIQSKTTGIIMSATEIGQIGGALLLTYYGGQGHRPKWIAGGMLVFALASILCSTPHFLFGGDVVSSVNSAAYYSSGARNATAYQLRELEARLCHADQHATSIGVQIHISTSRETSALSEENISVPLFLLTQENNDSSYPISDASTENITSISRIHVHREKSSSKCDSPELTAYQTRVTHAVLAVFFVSLLFIGIGATAVYTLGIPYIDDNVATRESPLYFGITIGVRIFGPVFGFLLGSFCTSVYVNFPFDNPGISVDDPQWIGAWWLGVFIVGAALIITSFPMMGFPRELPQAKFVMRYQAAANNSSTSGKSNGAICFKHLRHQPLMPPPAKKAIKKPSLKDFPAAIQRLLKNDILIYRTASSVLHILPIAGLYTFLPKYLESQFQLTATKANMISGMAGILVMGAGIFASGSFMRKFKPNASFVARWIALSALAYSIGMVILMWLGCPMNNLIGLSDNGDRGLAVQACNATCECRLGEFAPICSSEGKTYLSPCVAGCTKVTMESENNYTYTHCECLGEGVTAVNGFCSLQCGNLTWYIIVFSLFVLIHSTSEVGSMLLTLRCVDPQDKAMALGLISFAIGLFGNVPCPIIYGAVVDSSCLFWEDNCGKPGACRIYDPEKFRMVFHGLTAIIMLAAFFVDALVCYKASSVRFHEDEEHNLADEVVSKNGTNTEVICANSESTF